MKKQSVKFLIEEHGGTFFAWSLMVEGCIKSQVLKEYLGKSMKNSVIYFKNDFGRWATDLAAWRNLGKNLINSIESGKFSLDRLKNEHLQAGEKIFKQCNFVLSKDLESISNKQFIPILKDLFKNNGYITSLGFIPVVSDLEHGYLSTKLSNIIKSYKVSEEKIQDYIITLSSFTEKTLFWQEKRDLLSICFKLKKINKIKDSKQIKNHVKKYSWLHYGYIGPTLTEDDFLKSCILILEDKKTVSQQYNEHINSLKKLKKKQDKINKELKLDVKEKLFFKVAKEFMFLKSYRVEVRHRFHFTCDAIFKIIAKRLFVPVNIFNNALTEEVIQIITGQITDYKNINSRKSELLYVIENSKSIFFSKNKIDSFIKKVEIKESLTDKDLIEGQIAYPGKIIGKVKIINTPGDMEKMTKGDILVSIATQPDLLPAMKKAAALVTDAGGITSHAAIVSREIKVPCIVGTNFASKVLKDGDKVEVDANKGTVKKI